MDANDSMLSTTTAGLYEQALLLVLRIFGPTGERTRPCHPDGRRELSDLCGGFSEVRTSVRAS